MHALIALEESSHEPIELFSTNPKEYCSDIPREIIPLITSPCGKC